MNSFPKQNLESNMLTNMCLILYGIAAICTILNQTLLLPLETLKPGINPGLVRVESPGT